MQLRPGLFAFGEPPLDGVILYDVVDLWELAGIAAVGAAAELKTNEAIGTVLAFSPVF